MNSSYLYDRWTKAHATAHEIGGTVYKGFYECKSVDSYIAIDEVGNEFLYITLGKEAIDVFESPSLAGITFGIVSNPNIDDENKVLQIAMAPNADLEEAFEAFTVTLISRISLLESDVDVAMEIYNICKEYSDFFSKGGKYVLTPQEEQGLFGELLFLSKSIDRLGESAVNCWVGQDKSRHDFVFKGNNAVEVKTSLKQSRRIITVSNDMQLENPEGTRFFLNFLILEKNPSGRTIGELISDIYDNKLSSQVLRDAFDRKLLEGKIKRGSVPSNRRYVLIESHFYEINESFPRLTLEAIQSISTRIFNCKYKLDLDGYEEYLGDVYEYLAA